MYALSDFAKFVTKFRLSKQPRAMNGTVCRLTILDVVVILFTDPNYSQPDYSNKNICILKNFVESIVGEFTTLASVWHSLA